MESKIANYTKEIKSKKWAEIVMNCNASGISKTAWCRENNVSLKSFFYWQHKLRLSMINQAERESAAEIVQINLQDESPLMKPATASDKIIVRKNDIEIELPMTCEAIESVIKGLASC